MEPEPPEFDPELERKSRRNKIAVTIGFIALLIATLLMAQLLVTIVKPAPSDAPAAVESPAPEEN